MTLKFKIFSFFTNSQHSSEKYQYIFALNFHTEKFIPKFIFIFLYLAITVVSQKHLRNSNNLGFHMTIRYKAKLRYQFS